MAEQQFTLRWNNHQGTLVSIFDSLLQADRYTDCTLSAEGHNVAVHKILLIACSPYFDGILKGIHNDRHPVIILRDVKSTELQAIIDYMYRGEVNISQDTLGPILKVAQSLQIRGLCENMQVSSQSSPLAVSQSTQELEDGLSCTRRQYLNSILSPAINDEISSQSTAVTPSEHSVVETVACVSHIVEIPSTGSQFNELFLTKEEMIVQEANEEGSITVLEGNADCSLPNPSDHEEDSACQAQIPSTLESASRPDSEMQSIPRDRSKRSSAKFCLKKLSEMQRDTTMFQCKNCDKKYRHLRSLKSHTRRDCSNIKNFRNYKKLVKGDRRLFNTREKVIPCPNCSKQYSNVSDLAEHAKHDCISRVLDSSSEMSA